MRLLKTTILLLALTLLGACTGYDNVEAVRPGPKQATPVPVPSDTPAPPTPTIDLKEYEDPQGRSVWNFVILGSDYRAWDPQRQYEHTDAFILVNVQEDAPCHGGLTHAPADQPQASSSSCLYVTLMPIARELWLDEWGIIHSVYHRFDYRGVVQMVGQEFGVYVDAIFYTDLDKFTAFINEIGGLEVTPSMNIYDECGSTEWEFNAGETYQLDGVGVLCYARMRKGTPNGYFDRQVRHTEILSSLWAKMREDIANDPLGLINAVFVNPFVTVWPNESWLSLANLSVRANLFDGGLLQIEAASLDNRYLQQGTEIGPLADGTIGPYWVQYPSVDLRDWFMCVTQRDRYPINDCLLPY